MKKNIVILFLCICSFASAQQQEITALTIGNKMPDIELGRLINSPTPNIRYSALKGKLVILDFWATWCSSCINSLKALDSLQHSFGDKLVVLPVNIVAATGDTAAVMKDFLTKNKWFQFSCIVENKSLNNLFPHTIIPHDIWIGPDGVIRAITSGNEITKENIEKMLSDPSFTLKEKKDQMDYDDRKPFLVAGNGGSADNFIYRTIFTNRIPGIEGAMIADNDSGHCKIKSFLVTNCSPIVMYYPVLSMARNTKGVDPADIYIETKDGTHQIDTSELIKIDTSSKSYCYSSNLPEYISDSLFFRKYYLDDLNRLLKWKGRIEKKRVPALEIVRKTNNTDELLLDKSDSAEHFFFNDKARHILLGGRHVYFDNVVEYLRCFPGSPPIINNSGYTVEKVNIDLGLKWAMDDAKDKPLDYETVRKALNKYGLDIIKVPDGLVDVLVLSINNN